MKYEINITIQDILNIFEYDYVDNDELIELYNAVKDELTNRGIEV